MMQRLKDLLARMIGRKPQEAPVTRGSFVPTYILEEETLQTRPAHIVEEEPVTPRVKNNTPAEELLQTRPAFKKRPTCGARRKLKQFRAAQRRAIRSGVPGSKRKKSRSRLAGAA